MQRALLLLVVLAAPTGATSPALAVQAALADARRQPAAAVKDCRYLTMYNLPAKDRAAFYKVVCYALNGVSRESRIVRPVLVAPDLLRIDVADYGEVFPKTWEKLAEGDFYFHAVLVKQVVAVVAEEEVEVGYWRLRTNNQIVTPAYAKGNPATVWWEKTGVQKRPARKQDAKKPETVVAAAPWLPPADIAALSLLTHSEVPIVRADWFVAWTAIQLGRKGSGYYDFLGIKSRKDAEELAGLDRKAAERLRKELGALLSVSGVSQSSRQVFRYQTISGAWWETLDSATTVADQNALSQFAKGDFKHNAEEIYFSLPNRLFGLVACSDQGVLQDTVPDTIAQNKGSRSNDLKIHPCLNCVECHAEGLRPIDDWARKVYRNAENPGSPIILADVDKKRLKRLETLYLQPLRTRQAKDVAEYAEALLEVNGLTPERNASLFADEWYRYSYTDLGLDEVALELGVTRQVWLRALTAYVIPNGVPVIADPPLLAMVAGQKMRREHFQERFALMNQILAGSK